MTVIAYDKPVKDLIDELNATGHVSHVAYRKTSVTLHHNAGRLSHEGVLNVWKTRPASSHFDVDAAGNVAQYVLPNEYAWAVGNVAGNQRSISIEMANSTLGPNWEVAEATWRSAARLAGWLFANVVKAKPTTNNFFVHKHWSATACAGPFIDKIFSQVLAEAQKAYDEFAAAPTPAPAPVPVPKPTPAPTPARRKTNNEIAAEVWAGKWGSGSDRIHRLAAAGYNPNLIQALVNRGVGKTHPSTPQKSMVTLVAEVIAGKWGNGPDRVKRLTAAGYNAAAIQAEVNRRLG